MQNLCRLRSTNCTLQAFLRFFSLTQTQQQEYFATNITPIKSIIFFFKLVSQESNPFLRSQIFKIFKFSGNQFVQKILHCAKADVFSRKRGVFSLGRRFLFTSGTSASAARGATIVLIPWIMVVPGIEPGIFGIWIIFKTIFSIRVFLIDQRLSM